MDKLIALLDQFTYIVANCFQGNQVFAYDRAQGFESFINNFEIGQFTVAELLAAYTDQVLRKNGLKLP